MGQVIARTKWQVRQRTPRQIMDHFRRPAKASSLTLTPTLTLTLNLTLNLGKASSLLDRVMVVDKYGDWMVQWARQFDALEIDHLRSHSKI